MEETLALAVAGASGEERSERRRVPVPKAAPWLVFPHRKGMKDQAFYNICEPNIKTCRKCIPEMTRKTFWQKHSHQGWLVILCDDGEVDAYSNSNWNYGDCFLWNPLSLEIIQLPSLLHSLNKFNQHCIRDCVLSSPPITNNPDHDNDDDDSMVFFLFETLDENREQVLVFCCPGKDKQWRTKDLSGYHIEHNRIQIQSLLCYKGKLYGMCMNKWHLDIEKQLPPDDHDNDDQTLKVRPFKVTNDSYSPRVGGSLSGVLQFYLESGDELFMIDIYFDPRADKVVTSIEVLRLDFSLMAWEQLKSLGDHVLFIGTATTASCSADELGLTRGCLYFTLSQDQSLYKFELESNSITIILPCVKLPTPWFSAEWMMMPTTTRVTGGRRGIQDTLGKNKEEDNILEAEENKASINNDNNEKENQGQKHSGGKLEEARPWDNLSGDILELIASYLHPMEQIYFRAVCKANRSVNPAVNWRSFSTGIINATHLSPWLVFSPNNDTIYNFVYPMLHNNEKCLMNLSEMLVSSTIRFSKGGWLLMSKGRKTLFFYNPFTRATIQLPDLPKSYSFTSMSFSSLPTSPDRVVFGITHGRTDQVSIFFIARGNDSWRSCTFENHNLQKYIPCFNVPVFYEGDFYCLDYNGTLGIFDVENRSWKLLVKPQEVFSAVYPSFLVECDGKLLAVDLGFLGKSVGIFRLDFTKKVWVKVKSLGKHMLFISNTSCLSAIAPHSRMENKIYFSRLRGEGILFYSLDTCRYHSLGSPHSTKDFYDTTERLNCTWIEPNWSQTTEQELDWLSI